VKQLENTGFQVPTANEVKTEVNSARNLESIQAILNQMEIRNKELLSVDPILKSELQGYLRTAKIIPAEISTSNADTVKATQRALWTIQGWLDRVVAIHMDVRRVLRVLGKIEILVKRELAKVGLITQKTSKPSADQLISLVIPELRVHQNNWIYVKKMCTDVQDHLSGAKNTVQLQIKLDENLNWIQRRGT